MGESNARTGLTIDIPNKYGNIRGTLLYYTHLLLLKESVKVAPNLASV